VARSIEVHSQGTGDQLNTASTNRRKAHRYCFYADLEIDWGPNTLWGRVRDISREGMFIEIAEWPWVNAHFSARLALDAPLPIECVVRRIVHGEGIGVTIAFQSTEGETRFEALLRALRIEVDPAPAPSLTTVDSSKTRRTSSNHYEIFRQRVFDELADLQHADRQRILIAFVQAGHRCGIDVITEIVDKQRPASEVLAEVKRKQEEK
jgi:PilZ domain